MGNSLEIPAGTVCIAYPRQGSNYNGECKKYGIKHGHGIRQYPNGDIFVGEWVDGEKHGSGILKKENGDIIIQKWELDKLLDEKPN